MRRLESALVRGDPVPLHEQLRTQRRAAGGGLVLGVVALVGAFVGDDQPAAGVAALRGRRGRSPARCTWWRTVPTGSCRSPTCPPRGSCSPRCGAAARPTPTRRPPYPCSWATTSSTPPRARPPPPCPGPPPAPDGSIVPRVGGVRRRRSRPAGSSAPPSVGGAPITGAGVRRRDACCSPSRAAAPGWSPTAGGTASTPPTAPPPARSVSADESRARRRRRWSTRSRGVPLTHPAHPRRRGRPARTGRARSGTCWSGARGRRATARRHVRRGRAGDPGGRGEHAADGRGGAGRRASGARLRPLRRCPSRVGRRRPAAVPADRRLPVICGVWRADDPDGSRPHPSIAADAGRRGARRAGAGRRAGRATSTRSCGRPRAGGRAGHGAGAGRGAGPIWLVAATGVAYGVADEPTARRSASRTAEPAPEWVLRLLPVGRTLDVRRGGADGGRAAGLTRSPPRRRRAVAARAPRRCRAARPTAARWSGGGGGLAGTAGAGEGGRPTGAPGAASTAGAEVSAATGSITPSPSACVAALRRRGGPSRRSGRRPARAVSCGNRSRTSAASPATQGAEKLVPVDGSAV